MQSVAEVVAAERAVWDGVDTVDAAVFGTGDPDAIAAMVQSFCQIHLHAAPVGGLFYRASAGCVLGIRLATGDDVVLKAYQSRWEAPFLHAVLAVQRHAALEGMPCAQPRLAPVPLPGRPNLAVVESCWPDPGMRATRAPEALRVSAAGLARQIRLAADQGVAFPALAEHPLRRPGGQLYPEPHSPLFDFAATAEGAEWIDDLGRAAASVRDQDPTPPVVAHTDWSARNVRLDERQILAVYDWDSVAFVPEATALGHAAATWCVTSEPGGSTFPTFDEMSAYLAAYEDARGAPLSPAQWRSAGGAAAWVLAYTARCEHSLDVLGRARPDQSGARDRLADAGAALLELARP